MTLEELRQDFENWADYELVDLWNEYCDANGMEDNIYSNDEDFLNEMFASPAEAVRASFFGDYNWGDPWVAFNAYGNLQSYYDPVDGMDLDALAEWCYENNNEE